MSRSSKRHWGLWSVTVAAVVCATAGSAYYFSQSPAADAASPAHPAEPGSAGDTRVEVITPLPGGLERVTVQPGSIQAFEAVDLFAKVPGFLEWQKVDIGSQIHKGEEIARISVPEYDKQVEQAAAALDRAVAGVHQAEAQVTSVEADARAAEATVPQAQATLKSAVAMRSYRNKQFRRIRDLSEHENAIEQKLVDEEHDRLEAAVETENAARAGVTAAEAQLAAARAKILKAKADVEDAKAKVEVARAELDRAKVLVAYSHITAPFDGVVTRRNFFPSDFIRSADAGGHIPLLAVGRTDKLRVVVQVPDRDVLYANPGDEAIVEVDALPGRKFSAPIARMADLEDPQTRTMHVEIDLDNKDGQLRPGMYGRVTILLQKGAPNALTLPSNTLVGRSEDGKASVYVVRDGKLHLAQIEVGSDDGVHCEVLGGLKADDQVVVNFNGTFEEGEAVTAVPARAAPVPHH